MSLSSGARDTKPDWETLSESNGSSLVDHGLAYNETTKRRYFRWDKQAENPPHGEPNFVFPAWISCLRWQQQSVLLLAARGPDGIEKFHPCKLIVRNYRASVLRAAKFGRSLYINEHADTFMSLQELGDEESWNAAIKSYFMTIDGLPHHYHNHLMHGAEILAYKHPHPLFRHAWSMFYLKCYEDMHGNPETEEQMDHRLSDWYRERWD